MAKHIFRKELKILIQKYLLGSTSSEEDTFLDHYYGFFDKEQDILAGASEDENSELGQRMFTNIQEKMDAAGESSHSTYPLRMWMAAASVVFVIVTGVLAYVHFSGNSKSNQSVTAIQPATSKARLVLADGSSISLDSNAAIQIPQQNGVQLFVAGGRLAYKSNSGNSGTLLYNTMATPRGGQYTITLSDGTKVWLNTASSIRFPVAFSGAYREVQLNGEAYFEVAKNKAKPFRVLVEGKGTVEVLGTHFNISAYPDKTTFQTTLLEGSVKVSQLAIAHRVRDSALLKPGQQAEAATSGVHINKDPDVDAVMAWKTGKFYFEDTRLEDILTEFSRWYDVDIVYKCPDEERNKRFFMIVERTAPLEEVLKALPANNINFSINGRNIIVK